MPQRRVASVVTRDSSRVRPRVPARVAGALGRGMNPTLRLQPRSRSARGPFELTVHTARVLRDGGYPKNKD